MTTLTRTRIPFVTTTKMRRNISTYMDKVQRENSIIGVGRRDKIEVVVIKYPEYMNPHLNEITNINAHSRSFDFLKDEPDLYSVKDLKKRYV